MSLKKTLVDLTNVDEELSVAVDDDRDPFESRRHSTLTVQLADAVKWRSRQRKRGKRRNADSYHASSEDDPAAAVRATSSTSSTSTSGVRRRGKGAAIYVDEPESASSSKAGRVAETVVGDVDEFVVVDSPPSRRAKWMDVDLEATDQRAGKRCLLYTSPSPRDS